MAQEADRASPIIMLGFIFGAVAMFATMYGTQAILPDLGRAFDVSPDRAGLTVSVTIVAAAVFAWVWGPISDRIGRKRAMVIASALLVLPTAAGGLAPTFPLLLLARALQGACMPGLITAGLPYVREVFSPRLGGRAMGYWLCALVVGGLIGRVGVAMVASVWGWRVGLGGLAVLALVGSILLATTLPPAEQPAAPDARSSSFSAVGAHLRNRHLLAGTAAACGLFFAFVGIFSFATFRLESPPFDLTTAQTSLVFLFWGLGLVGPSLGRLGDRIGWRRLLCAAVAVAALSALVTIPQSFPLLILGLAGVTVGMFTGSTAAQMGVTESAESNRGVAAALYFSSFYTTGAIGGWLPGRVYVAAGWTGLIGLAVGALVLAAIALTAAASPKLPA